MGGDRRYEEKSKERGRERERQESFGLPKIPSDTLFSVRVSIAKVLPRDPAVKAWISEQTTKCKSGCLTWCVFVCACVCACPSVIGKGEWCVFVCVWYYRVLDCCIIKQLGALSAVCLLFLQTWR